MDITKRLFRRPVSTAVWVAVLTLAALLIGVGASVLHAAHAMSREFDSKQMTIAVHRLPREQNEDGTFTTTGDLQSGPLYDDDIAYLRSLPQVKDIDLRYLSGAYIEGVYTKLGLADFYGRKQDNGLGVNDGSNGVVLIGEVESAFTLNFGSVTRYDLSAFGLGSSVGARYNCAILRVEDAIVMHPDYPLYSRYDGDEDYTGRVTLMFPAFGDGRTSFFKVGKRYAVRGAYDPMPSGYGEDYPIGKEPLCPNVNLISESLLSAFIEGDSLACYRVIEADWNNVIDPFTGEIALGHATPVLSRGDRVPVAVEWNGTAEELAKDEVWGKFIEEYRMAQCSFPVLGTNRLESMYSFVQNEASIVQGRSFTKDEYDTGAKVLVMDEGVASSAGLSVGDKVSIKQFRPAIGYDEGNQSFHNDFYSASDEYNNPTLGSNVFFHGLPEGEAEEFTIVGLYRIENEWKDALCSFTPNTLFMPRAAQTELACGGPSKNLGTEPISQFDAEGNETQVILPRLILPRLEMGGVCGVYMSIILKNGSMNEFLERLEADCEYENIPFGEDGYFVKRVKGLNNKTFFCFDQGYEAVKASVEGVWASALKLLGMTSALALLLFIAYLLLYQAPERRTLGIMRSLGAKPQRTRRYLFISGLVLAAVGIAIGTALSAAFANLIADKLAGALMGENAELMRESLAGDRLPAWLYALIALIELIIAAVLLHAHAAHLSKKEPRKLLVK